MAKLRTFVLVYEDKTLSPPLVSVREYAKWLEVTFNETICHMHLYLNSKKADGQIVSEWHPGTRLGSFYDNQSFHKPELQSYYLSSNDKGMQQLIKHTFAELKDCSIYHKKSMLRLYTVQQIELYVKTSIDKSFNIANDIMDPKQIVLSKSDMDTLIKPVVSKRKALF